MTTASKPSDHPIPDDITQIREDLAQLRQDVSALAGDLLGAAREGVSGAVGTAKERGKEVADALEEQVHDHPLTSLAVAFGVGLLLGAVIRRV